MYEPNEIAIQIAEYQEQIDSHLMQIDKWKRQIAELMCLAVCNSEGDVTSYADCQ